MHGLRWFQRPRSRTKFVHAITLEAKTMELEPALSYKRSSLLCFAAATSLGFLLARGAAAQAMQSSSPPAPMQPAARDGAEYRWLNKAVLSSRLLDDMEDLSGWSFKGEGEMSLSSEHTKKGMHSLEIRS